MSNAVVRKPGHLKLKTNLLHKPHASYEYSVNEQHWEQASLPGIVVDEAASTILTPETYPWFVSRETALNAAKPMPNALKIVDWNVLFDLYHFEKIYHPERWGDPWERYQSILDTLLELDGHVVCLQEVTNVFLEYLQSAEKIRESYACTHIPSKSLIPYGQVILVKKQFAPFRCRTYRYDKNGDKQAVIADLLFSSEESFQSLSIASIHLQSGEPTSEIFGIRRVTLHSAMRLVHQALIAEGCSSQHSSIVAGDFNFDSDSTENTAVYDWICKWPPEIPPIEPTGFVDTHSSGVTMDSHTNTTTQALYPGEEPTRLDRILLKSSLWNVDSCFIETAQSKTTNSKIGLFPSDHFAVVTQIRSKL
jgi:endonuclease/exonuclease/phosphatase family metal-dependent hydrolase